MQIIFKNRFGELRSGWSIAAAIALVMTGQMIARALITDDNAESIGGKILITVIYGIIAVMGGLFLFKLVYKRSVREMGVIKEGWFSSLLHGLAMGSVTMILVFAAMILSGQRQVLSFNPQRLFTIGLIVEFLSVCVFMFSEELYCRGYIMTALKTTRNKWVIIFSSSVIFGVAHFLNPGMSFLSLFNTCLAGLLWAFMFIKTGKLWLSTGYHIGHNFLAGDILGIPTSGGVSASEGVFTTSHGNIEFLAGGINGSGGSIYMTILLLLGFLYVRIVVKKPDGPVWTMDSDMPLIRRK